MERMKKVVSLLLCLVMVVGLLPASILSVDAAETVLDAAIFCSDVHGNPSTVTSVFNGIKSADSTFNPTTASFVGDTQTTASSVTSAAQEVYSGVQCIYAFGNHDDEGDYGIDDFTGLSYGSSSTNYYIYTISENDMSTSSPDTSGFTSTVEGLDKTKPLFIISHMPLHARRDDNTGAAAWYTAISAAAESMDIFFFWAHNHTGDNEVDQAAYYVAKNGSETISVEGGSTVTPNFTYANAGYIDPPNTPARNNVATAVRIYDDSVNLTVYNANGVLTGSYAVNETVTRQFASGSTEGGDSDGSTEETTAPTEGETTTEEKEVYVLVDTMTVGEDYLIANGNSGTVTLLGQSSGEATTTTAEVKTSGDYTYIETADSGCVWNATEHTNSSASGPRLINAGTYAMYTNSSSVSISSNYTSGAPNTRYWTYSDGQLACVSTNSSTTYYLTYSGSAFAGTSTATDGIYIYEKQTIEVSSDGTVSGGGSTEDGEDDTTGGSTETVVGEGKYTTADDGSYQKVTFGTEGEKKTVYVLVSTPTAGKNYIIASGNSGSVYALKENTTTGTSVTVNAATDNITAPYIENSDNAIVWTASSGMNFKSVNGGYYLNYTQSSSGSNKPGSGSSSSYSLSFSTSSASDWTAGTNALYREGSQNDYYLRYNNGWTMGGQNSEYNVYFYEEQTIDTSSSVTYSVTASDIEHFYTYNTTTDEEGNTTSTVDLTKTATITKSVTDGTPDGTYTYTVVTDEDGNVVGDDIIASIDQETGVITFNGTEGTAQVKVSYSWTDDKDTADDTTDDVTYTIWQVIDVTATSPYYTLDLHKAVYTFTEVSITEFEADKTYYVKNDDGTYSVATEYVSGTTYYTASATLGDEITETVAIKGVEAGDTYSVWAVIKYFDGTTEGGVDQGDVDDQDIEWTSSDTTIATVDPSTGIITFTGKEGSVTITATYKNGNRPSDSVVISVTQSQYSVPSDGTNDFPEYPNEGAIRYDKTATAVGNFSETGIAMVELSMTGVPYTTGSEIDVVIMLDMTGSMTTDSISAARASAIAFADQIIKNKDGTYNKNRISVQQFNKDGVTELWTLSAVTADTYDSLKSAINGSKQATGGTPYSTALQACYEILYAAKSDGTGNNRKQFCVFVSDGTPTSVTYITDTTTPTTTTTVSFTRNDATYTQTVPAYSTGSTTDTFGSSDNSYHEYWSQLMINNSVAVYGVYTSVAAGSSGSSDGSDGNGGSGGSVNDTEVGTICMNKVATDSSKVYVVPDAEDTSALTGVFTNIANEILQAATDVTVEDKITDEYTMIFDLPTGDKTITGLDSQEFYIEFVKYTLDDNHERTDTVTSVTKLYLGVSDGTYYAASDSTGTAYAAPVFEQTVIGEKGTLYYWTTDDNYASKAAVTYTINDDTYYFVPYGMEENEDGTAPESWYNMTSGAYAYGTVDSTTNMSTDLVIATPYFVYNASTKMLYWTVDKLDTNEYALRYFLYLDNSATEVGTDQEVDAATYPTNDHAYITYTNFRGNDCQQKFPIPQLTWNGAQVSYVFYLVNAAGQPINKSGQVVDFANAVFVTDVYTKAVVWNKGTDGTTGTGELSADWLADELLPGEYTIYDELAGFTLNVYEKADGTTIKNQFTIEGDTAANISSSLNTRLNLETTESTVSVTTTKVYNTKAGTKITGYGTYDSATLTSIDFSNTTVAFAVVWESKLVEDVIVVDYGLDVLINVVQNDLLQNTISGIGLGNEAYGSIAMNTGVIGTSQLGTANLTIDGNTISIENENAIRFHQDDMTFTEPVKFYYESPVKFYEDSEQKTGYMYSSVTVIPATTIYYEDDFLTLESYTVTKNEDGTSTSTKDTTSKWTTDGTTVNETQDQDRPGASQISEALDADNNYGYDSAYEDVSTHSMGSAKKITVDSSTRGEATFTFYGTGFDVISMTSNTTGTLIVQLYSGASATGTAVKSLVVDTYYGYTQNADGEWVVSVNAPNALYQVPVMKMSGLTYGQYTVKIIAGYNDKFNHTTDGIVNEGDTDSSYELYLDAIRIYDPCGNDVVVDDNGTVDTSDDITVGDIYAKDGEGWPQYIELRNNIIEASNYTVTENEDGTVTVSGTNLSGAIFIDSSDATTSIADYVSYGPNNELYLAAGQSVSFALDQTYANIIADVQIAMKLGNGTSVTYEIYSAATDGTKSNTITGTLETATDLYYGIKNPDGDPDTNDDLTTGTIVISNTSGGILSITNIKVTYTQNPNGTTTTDEGNSDEGIMTTSLYVDEDVATAAVMSLRSMPVTEEPETEVTEPETEATEPETEATEPETEATEPETEATEPETEATEPETEATEPETEPTEPEDTDSSIGTIIRVIKKLFGWLFG